MLDLSSLLTWALSIIVATASVPISASADEHVERGKYLATIMDCGGCHTTGSFVGQPDPAKYLAGSDQGWAVPGAVFWPSNITPDAETGIGKWSKADIVKLLKTGLTPEGREVAPMMPWRSYSALTDADADALASFLKAIPAVRHAVPGPANPRDVTTPVLTVTVLPKS